MPLYKSETANGRRPEFSLIDATGGSLRFEYVFTANLLSGDVIEMGKLPANRVVPLDAMIICDDLDDGAGLVFKAGVLNAAKTDLGTGPNDVWFTGATIGQSGGVVRAASNAVFLTGPSEFVAKPLGIVLTTAAVTANMVGKRIVMVIEVNG